MYKQQPAKMDKCPLNTQGAILKEVVKPINISLEGIKYFPATDTPGSLPIRYQQPM